MNGSAGEVVALLHRAIEHVDRASITAKRAQADAEQAHFLYMGVAHGTGHPRIRQAIDESRIASDKAGKVARLLAEAATHLANYVNLISPGSMPTNVTSVGGAVEGDEIVADARRRASRFSRATRRVAENAEHAGDYAKKFADFLDAARPKGTTANAQRPEPPPAAPTLGTPGDAAQSLVVTGAAMIATALKFVDIATKKREQRERSERVSRSDPPDGQG